MRLVVTGALGHIGSRLIDGFRPGDFDEVVLFDNLSTQRFCSLFNLPADVPFRFVEGDICADDLDAVFAGADVVVHLAAMTNAAASFDVQARVEQVNFEGTARVAAAAARQGCRLVFLSTTSVYGTQAETVDEACPVEDLRPQSPYASSKLRAEQMLHCMGETDGLRFFIGRFGTIYDTSKGMRFHTAINKFCWQASVGQPLTIWRTAENQVRPYLDLHDGVRAIRHVIATDLFDNRVYNVLTENASVRQIVDLIRAIVPDVNIDYVDSQIMNQLSYSVLADRFKSTAFECHGDLRKGIERTLALIAGLRQARQSVIALADGD